MNRICLIVMVLVCAPVIADDKESAKPTPGKQVERSFKTKTDAIVKYLLYLPKEYEPDGKKLPLMLFLHGRGESYGPLDLVAKWGPPRMAKGGEDFPFIIVSPQCPRDDRWASDEQQQRVLELLDVIISDYNVDTTKMHLTGLSMGGYGSWRMAADHPKKFATVAPVCGAGDPENGKKLTEVPIWIWHGTEDQAVPFKHSVEMYDAIKEAGGTKVTFTSLEGIGHNSWSAAYATPELYHWMMSHSQAP